MCLWERNVGGETEAIVIEREVTEEGEGMLEGVSFFGGGLDKGECGVMINWVKEDNLGLWLCSLLTASTGRVLSGEVNVRLEGNMDRGKPGSPYVLCRTAILSKTVSYKLCLKFSVRLFKVATRK